jgi:hypothetical protein
MYSLVVIEDDEGELHNLVFSNKEILDSWTKGLKYSHRIPRYTLKLCCGTEIFIICMLASLILGVLAGWFLRT